VAVIVLAGLVNMIELLCTAGFPAVYTQILTMQQLPTWEYYGYLGLYNVAYIFDDSLMVTIAVITLSQKKLQERTGRWLKLTSGLVMAGLGTVLFLQPKWLI
jgi:threonine/homoserine/homoserine lactone efflux protein